MEKINPTLLNDTLRLVQLARETAKLKGSNTQAEKFGPVVDQLQTIVNKDNNHHVDSSDGILGQADFKTMFNATQNKLSGQTTVSSSSIEDRNRIVGSMASGGMNDMEIAQKFGMTRDEVRMVINLSNAGIKR